MSLKLICISCLSSHAPGIIHSSFCMTQRIEKTAAKQGTPGSCQARWIRSGGPVIPYCCRRECWIEGLVLVILAREFNYRGLHNFFASDSPLQ